VFFLFKVEAEVEVEVGEAVVHIDMPVFVVEGVEPEGHASEIFVVVIDQSKACDEVDVELVEAEMSELGVLLGGGACRDVVGVVVGDVVGQSWREGDAEEEVLGEDPVVGVSEVDGIVVVFHGIEKERRVNIGCEGRVDLLIVE